MHVTEACTQLRALGIRGVIRRITRRIIWGIKMGFMEIKECNAANPRQDFEDFLNIKHKKNSIKTKHRWKNWKRQEKRLQNSHEIKNLNVKSDCKEKKK